MAQISGISPAVITTQILPSTAKGGEDKSSFSGILSNAIEQMEMLDDAAGQDVNSMLSGETQNLSDLLVTAKKSELAVELTVQIRNKAMDAYKEIMNMQV